mmetsp:Transcript_85177/g.214799  ORF Transcript_85177/g.214799 Transcript_85177/m.214799 type:complete len:530 (+) Transcript_85177:155-1744(+)
MPPALRWPADPSCCQELPMGGCRLSHGAAARGDAGCAVGAGCLSASAPMMTVMTMTVNRPVMAGHTVHPTATTQFPPRAWHPVSSFPGGWPGLNSVSGGLPRQVPHSAGRPLRLLALSLRTAWVSRRPGPPISSIPLVLLTRSHPSALHLHRQPDVGLHIQHDAPIGIGIRDRRRKPLAMRLAPVLNVLILHVGASGICRTPLSSSTRRPPCSWLVRWCRTAFRPTLRTAGCRRIIVLSLHLIQHLLHHLLDHWSLQDLGSVGPSASVSVKHLLDEGPEAGRVLRGCLGSRPPGDPLDQPLEVGGIERHTPCAHLVQDAAHGPDIRTPRVGLALADLWAQVVRRADLRLGTSCCALEHLGNAEVAHLQIATLRQEEVPRLQIAVQDVHIMDVLQRKHGLSEPPQDLLLREGSPRLPHLFDFFRQISALAVVHDNAEPTVLMEALPVPDNVRMLQRGENLAFFHSVLLFLPRSSANVDHLDNSLRVLFPVPLMLHEDRRTERALPDLLDLLVAMLSEGRTSPVLYSSHRR